MALITCPSCRHPVSSMAETCPHCGHPVKRKKASGCLITMGVLLCIVGIFAWPVLVVGLLVLIMAGVSKS